MKNEDKIKVKALEAIEDFILYEVEEYGGTCKIIAYSIDYEELYLYARFNVNIFEKENELMLRAKLTETIDDKVYTFMEIFMQDGIWEQVDTNSFHVKFFWIKALEWGLK